MSDRDPKPKAGKSLADRVREAVEGALEELQRLLDVRRPVRVPVAAGPKRPR